MTVPFGFDQELNDWILATGDPTGFSDPQNVISTYDPTARTITLTGTVKAYYKGRIIPELASGWVSAAHSATTDAQYFLYYNGSAFVWDTVPWTFPMLQIAFINYGATYKFALRETHGLMPWSTHEEFHETIGCFRESGGTLGAYVLASTTAANRRPTVSAAVIHDEDLITTVAALAAGSYTQAYNAAGATAVTAYTLAAAEIVPVLANNPYYNQLTGGLWKQTLMANNSYMSVWLVAVPTAADAGSQAYRYLWIQGQSNGTLAAQQALTPGDLNLGTLAIQATEFVFIAKVILRFQGGNWDFTSVSTLTGNRFIQVAAPAGNFLSDVTTDTSLTGNGTIASPLSVRGLSIATGKILTASNTLTLAAGADGYTLTVPATGTAALLATANTFTANQEINLTSTTSTSGLSIGVTHNRTVNAGGIPITIAPTFTDTSTQSSADSRVSAQVMRLTYIKQAGSTGQPSAYDVGIVTVSAINESLNSYYSLYAEGPIIASGKTLGSYTGIRITAPSGLGTVTTKKAMTIDTGAGNVTIGDYLGIGVTPVAPLSFAATTGNKISFYDGISDRYGIAIQSFELQLQAGQSTSGKTTFGSYDETTFTEVMRIQNDGKVGIGTPLPLGPLHAKGLYGQVQYMEFLTSGATAQNVITGVRAAAIFYTAYLVSNPLTITSGNSFPTAKNLTMANIALGASNSFKLLTTNADPFDIAISNGGSIPAALKVCIWILSTFS